MQRLPTILFAIFLCITGSTTGYCRHSSTVTRSIAGPVNEFKLPNGLTVLLLESHDAPVACTYVYYKVGSRNETTGITGISHQLEHMMFKGTVKEFPHPGYIDLLIGRHGGVNNAETTSDYTDYFLLVPADQLDLALRIEADRMTQAAMDPQQLIAEKRVVLSELEGDENQNTDFLYNNMRSAAFQFHPYHYPVIGSKYDVQHFTREQVYSYYRSHYCPNNAVLVVVGDFSTAALTGRIKALWKDVKSQVVPKTVIDPEPKQMGERTITVRRAGTTAYVNACFHIPSATNADLPVLDVLGTILSTGRSSRLYRTLVDTELATAVNAGANYGLDPELFEISTSARAGVSAEKLQAALLEALDGLKKELVGDRELQKAKNETRAGFVFSQDGVQAKASRLGYFQVETGSWTNINTYLARVQAVTAADIMRVTNKYFQAENRTVARFEPNGERADPSADSSSGGHSAHYRGAVHRPEVSNIGMDTSANYVTPQSHRDEHKHVTIRLKNGLTLIVQEDHSNPTITLGGFYRAGSISDPSDKLGLANLTASMMTRGTQSKTADQIAEATDFLGASVGFAAHRERIDISANMLKEDLPTVLATLADCMQNPAFPDSELAKERGETETAIQEAQNDTAQRASQKLMDVIYRGNAAFAHDVHGTLDSVHKIKSEDLRNFWSNQMRPENTTLVLVGDVGATQAVAALTGAFETWKPESTRVEHVSPPILLGPRASSGTDVIVMPDKSQDDVVMGEPGVVRNAPDYEAAQLMNLILGGDEFVGRVGKRVRDTEGLAYYAYTAFSPGNQAGPWVFRAGVNPANVTHAITSAKDEIRKMVRSGVTDSELAWAKDNMVGSMELSMETASGIAAQLEDQTFYRLGDDYVRRFPDLIRKVTRQQASMAAVRYLHLDELFTVVAGPAVPGLQGSAASGK